MNAKLSSVRQAKTDRPRKGRNIKQPPHPCVELRRPGGGTDQFLESGPHNQRQHQQDKGIKSETDRGDKANQPARQRKPFSFFHARIHQAPILPKALVHLQDFFASSRCREYHVRFGPGTVHLTEGGEIHRATQVRSVDPGRARWRVSFMRKK